MKKIAVRKVSSLVIGTVATVGLSLGAATGAATGVSVSEEGRGCPSTTNNDSPATELDGESVDECDLEGVIATFEDATYAIEVPEPGTATDLIIETLDDGPTTYTVEVDNEGVIETAVENDWPGEEIDPREPAAIAACSQTDFRFYTAELNYWPGSADVHKWRGGANTFDWYINQTSIPSAYAGAVASIRGGLQNWTNLNTDCPGYSDNVAPPVSYEKILNQDQAWTRAPDPSGGYQDFCPATNGNNVVEFRHLWGGALAAACASRNYTTNRIFEADMAFNTSYSWTNNGGASACQTGSIAGPYDIENVATHEFGHVLGLRDLYRKPADAGGIQNVSNDRALTMWGMSGTCEIKKRTLGAGDIHALRLMY